MLKRYQGIGESIRGQTMGFADQLGGDSGASGQAIANKGRTEVEQGVSTLEQY